MAGRFVDFYALLSVPEDATTQALRDAIIEQRRVWEPRQEAGDPASRAAAEDRIRDIDVAEVVLLDPDQRLEYDEEWHSRRRGQRRARNEQPVPSPPVPDWSGPYAAKDAAGRFDGGRFDAGAPAVAVDWGEPPAPNGSAHAGPPDLYPAENGSAHAGPAETYRAEMDPPQNGGLHVADWARPDANGSAHADWGEQKPAESQGAPLAGDAAVLDVRQPFESSDTAEPAPVAAEDSDLQQIKELLARGDRSAAISIAQRAVQQGDDSGAAWAVRAAAAAGLGNISAAIENYHQATLLEPDNPTYHYDLARCYEQVGDHDRALGSYDASARLAPHVAAYRAAVGNALIRCGRPADGLPLLEQVVGEVPTDQAYRSALALAMHDTCVHAMTALPDGLVCITTADQAGTVERLMTRASALVDPTEDPELARDIAEKLELAQLAQQRSWRPPVSWWLLAPIIVVAAGGIALFVTWWAGLIALIVLVGAAVALGLQPNWWHVGRAVHREAHRPPPPQRPPTWES